MFFNRLFNFISQIEETTDDRLRVSLTNLVFLLDNFWSNYQEIYWTGHGFGADICKYNSTISSKFTIYKNYNEFLSINH